EDPAELVPARDHPGIEVRAGADLEDDPPLADHSEGARVVGRLDPVPDPIGLEELDDAGHFIDWPGLARMDRQPETELARAAEELAVVGDAEGRRFRSGDVDPDDAAVPPGDRLLDDDLVQLERERP